MSDTEPTKLTLKPSFRHLQQAMYVARAVGEGPYRRRPRWWERLWQWIRRA